MQPPCKRDETDGATRRGERRQAAPFASGNIVFHNLIERVLVNRRGKSPRDIDFAIQCRNAGMGGAFRHWREIAPLAKLATAGIRLGHTVHKELLRRRGVIRSSLVRAPSDALDEITRRELDAVCDRLGIGNAVA